MNKKLIWILITGGDMSFSLQAKLISSWALTLVLETGCAKKKKEKKRRRYLMKCQKDKSKKNWVF